VKKKIAIIQPNYIPWIGYFKIIKNVDEFIFLDDVQFTKRDWRNRNFINSEKGKILLSIPVKSKNKYLQKINETECINNEWKKDHLNKIRYSYKDYPNFEEIFEILNKSYYKTNSNNLLTNLYNILFELIDFLKIDTKISFSKDMPSSKKKLERIIEICKYKKTDVYLSGPSASNYIDTNKMRLNELTLEYMNYENYNYEVKNKNHKFIEKLSIIDLLMNSGRNSHLFFK
jgi:hypothetical protein